MLNDRALNEQANQSEDYPFEKGNPRPLPVQLELNPP